MPPRKPISSRAEQDPRRGGAPAPSARDRRPPPSSLEEPTDKNGQPIAAMADEDDELLEGDDDADELLEGLDDDDLSDEEEDEDDDDGAGEGGDDELLEHANAQSGGDDDDALGELPEMDDDALVGLSQSKARPRPPVPEEGEDSDIYGENDYPTEDEDYDAADPRRPPPVPRKGGSPEDTRVFEAKELEEADSPDATRVGPPVSLRVEAGPDMGSSRRFKGVRMVVGRTNDCDFKLSDQSVSRRHLELVQGEKGVLLRDLGSGNGTKVNGEKVKERVLQHGDEIAIGKTRFRFLDDLAAVKQIEEEKAAKAAPAAPQEELEDEEEGALEEGEGDGDEEVDEEADDEDEEDEGEEKNVEATAAKEAEGDEGLRADTLHEVPAHTPLGKVHRQLDGLKKVVGWGALSGSQRTGILLGGGVGLVLMFFIGSLMIRSVAPAPAGPRQAAAQQRIEKGRQALEKGRYEEAVALLEQAERISPGIDGERLLLKAQIELGARRSLDAARTAMETGRFDQARAEIAKFPEKAGQPHRAEKEKLAAELDVRYLDYVVAEVEKAIVRKDFDTALRRLAELPEDKQLMLAPKVSARQMEAEEERREQEKHQEISREANRRRAQVEREGSIQAAFAAVSRKFHAGEYERAALECDRVIEQHIGDADILARANSLKRLIPAFARSFDDAQKKFQVNALQSAVTPLTRARELYQQIGFPGALGDRIDEDLASASISSAEASIRRDDLVDAASHYREALRLVPGDPRAKQGMDRLSRRADQLVHEAMMGKSRDKEQSIAKLRLVIEIAPPSSPAYRKAKEQLASIAP